MKIILAVSQDNVIGDVDIDGSHFIPWSIPEDLKRFKELTTGHKVIMGRRTWESLPKKFRPLPNRMNLVLSRDPNFVLEGVDDPKAARIVDFSECVQYHQDAFVIGGREIYDLFAPYTNMAFVTTVHKDFATETSIYGPNLLYQTNCTPAEQGLKTGELTYSYATYWR